MQFIIQDIHKTFSQTQPIYLIRIIYIFQPHMVIIWLAHKTQSTRLRLCSRFQCLGHMYLYKTYTHAPFHGKHNSTIFNRLFAYLFVIYIFINFHFSKKKHTPLYYRHAATSPQNIKRHNFTECFTISVTLARLSTSSLRMVEDRNM